MPTLPRFQNGPLRSLSAMIASARGVAPRRALPAIACVAIAGVISDGSSTTIPFRSGLASPVPTRFCIVHEAVGSPGGCSNESLIRWATSPDRGRNEERAASSSRWRSARGNLTVVATTSASPVFCMSCISWRMKTARRCALKRRKDKLGKTEILSSVAQCQGAALNGRLQIRDRPSNRFAAVRFAIIENLEFA